MHEAQGTCRTVQVVRSRLSENGGNEKGDTLSHPNSTAIRADDLLRHLQDLRTGTYEGVKSGSEKESLYRRGKDPVSPPSLSAISEGYKLCFYVKGGVQMS